MIIIVEKPGGSGGGVKGVSSGNLNKVVQHNQKTSTHGDRSGSYLPIIVECCWTAASSRRSKMVHSPMVISKWHHTQKKVAGGTGPSPGSQDQPALFYIGALRVPLISTLRPGFSSLRLSLSLSV